MDNNARIQALATIAAGVAQSYSIDDESFEERVAEASIEILRVLVKKSGVEKPQGEPDNG